MTLQLLSHPDKLLIEHLRETARAAMVTFRVNELNFTVEFFGIQYDLTETLGDLVYLAAAFHDIGKSTSFFQNYIRNPKETHSSQKKSHALLSALFVYYTVTEYLKKKEYDSHLKMLLAVFSFAAVKRHHGKLNNLPNELYISKYSELLIEQVQSIHAESINEITRKLTEESDLDINWQDFVEFIVQRQYAEPFDDFAFDFLNDKLKELAVKTRLELFYFYQLLYSTLLYSDKNEVITESFTINPKSPDIVGMTESYRGQAGFNHPKNEINRLKNEAFYHALAHLEKVFKTNNHVYSLTLPTGLGKTITAFALAGKMKTLIGNKYAKTIINIPFTSIIDQNYEVYADILKTKRSDILLKHHHLAEPKYKTDENVAHYDKSKFLIETWQSSVVVTTFVQLLESFFSCDKTKIMKLSQLSGAIILLDEIQTVPYPLWETIRNGFNILGKKYNIYFILISATQPLIFTPKIDITEIVPNYKKYFRIFNRTRLNIQHKPISFNEFKMLVSDYILEQRNKDTLIILNTKNAAREFFIYIRETVDMEINDLYFMTTFITPFERKKVINRIKQSSKNRKIIVSTQLVEAGVDISVDTVFRQMAPLDSIIQSAGRANRYGEKDEISDVYIYDIKEIKKAGTLIYGFDLLQKTENILKEYHTVEEKDYLSLIEKYFIEVRKQSDNTSNKLLKAMTTFEFADVSLQLIQNIKTEPVYIQLNQKAEEIWEKYVSIVSYQNLKPWEKEALFCEIKSEFYDFVINVPVPYNREHIVFDSEPLYGFYVSFRNMPSVHYDYSPDDFTQNTGYNDSENQTSFI